MDMFVLGGGRKSSLFVIVQFEQKMGVVMILLGTIRTIELNTRSHGVKSY
jgi:hypothetical protein